MNLVILGMPGAGKGTQSAFISNFFDIPHISTGDMLRHAIHEKTKIGLEAESYIKAGHFVPDDVILKIMAERLAEDDCKKGFLLDGFPRNLVQAEELDVMLKNHNLKIDHAINLSLEQSEVISRLTSRRVCKKCASVYNVKNLSSDSCPKCGGEIIIRDDDKEEVIISRLKVYTEQTEPLIKYFSDKNILFEVDASVAIEDVWNEIKKMLEKV